MTGTCQRDPKKMDILQQIHSKLQRQFVDAIMVNDLSATYSIILIKRYVFEQDSLVSYLALIGFSAVGKEGQLITASHYARSEYLSPFTSINGKVDT